MGLFLIFLLRRAHKGQAIRSQSFMANTATKGFPLQMHSIHRTPIKIKFSEVILHATGNRLRH